MIAILLVISLIINIFLLINQQIVAEHKLTHVHNHLRMARIEGDTDYVRGFWDAIAYVSDMIELMLGSDD